MVLGSAALLGAILVWVQVRDDGTVDESGCRDFELELSSPQLDLGVEAGAESLGATLERVALEGSYVVAMAEHPDGRRFFLTRDGNLMQFRGDAEAVVLALDVPVTGERGALGFTLSPDGEHAYLTYTPDEVENLLVEYQVTSDGLDPATRREVLAVENTNGQHMMNNVVFGPDGYLYVGLGDGNVVPPDGEQSVAQDLTDLRGKILRIDPTEAGSGSYGTPDDNPFVGVDGAAPEIFAAGMRNPWRFSFDSATGDLWIGDVGAECSEEIDRVDAGGSGRNFGWRAYEGPYRIGEVEVEASVAPAAWYPRDVADGIGQARCAVVAGFVYRGTALPELVGRYVFGDLCDERIYAADIDPAAAVVEVVATLPAGQLLAFGEGVDGELFALTTDGAFRVVAG